jgi:hypothetical protein
MRPLRALFDRLDSNEEIDEKELFKQIPLTKDDVFNAINSTKPSCDQKLRKRYLEWQESFGSV